MRFFDIFKKEVSAEQSKTYICARCKKEITDSESKWIGNHRFCKNCAAPSKSDTINKHLEEEAKEAGYQAYMDYAKGSLTPEEAYLNRGFIKDKDGKFIYGKLATIDDAVKQEENSYICARCKKKITDSESKWIGNHRFCINCATPIKEKPLTETVQKDLCKKYTTGPLASTFEYAYKLVAISHKMYMDGNSMAYFVLLNGLGHSIVEGQPGAGHNYYIVVDAIHSYKKNNSNMNVKDGYVEGIKTSISLAGNVDRIACIFNYLNYEAELKKNGINVIEIDIAYLLEQLISVVTEKQARFEEQMPDFQEWFDKMVEHIKKTL